MNIIVDYFTIPQILLQILITNAKILHELAVIPIKMLIALLGRMMAKNAI